jgi:hypothetical protein
VDGNTTVIASEQRERGDPKATGLISLCSSWIAAPASRLRNDNWLAIACGAQRWVSAV